jgi:hypothetical protein
MISLIVTSEDKKCFLYFIFSESYRFEEHGIYGWDIKGDSCSGVHIIQNPDKTYIRMYKTDDIKTLGV